MKSLQQQIKEAVDKLKDLINDIKTKPLIKKE